MRDEAQIHSGGNWRGCHCRVHQRECGGKHRHPFRASARNHAVRVISVHSVNLSALPRARANHAWNHGPLLRNGQFSGNLPVSPSRGSKARGPLTSVTPKLHLGFNGIAFAAANCGCQPPDVNAAVGPANIVESVNLDLAVYSRSGALLKSTGLNTFLGTSDSLSDPRVVYDPTWNRYVLSLTDITAVGATPTLWLAASATSDPAGGWFIYHLGFGGGPFPAGELLDYPVLGMDADSVAVTTNNFAQPSAGNYTYNGSTVFAAPKARLYNGFGFGAPAFGVPFGTAPAIIGDSPTQNTGRLYLLDADSGASAMHVYYLTNSSRPDSTALTLQGDAPYTFAPPSRRVNQPGTSQTLDPLDGRLVWAPMQLDNLVWFAHGVNLGGFPSVNYGYVDTNATTVTTSNAYHSGSSDDFNPAIAAQHVGNSVQEVLTWAYTDTPNNVPTTDVAAINAGTSLAHQVGRIITPAGASTNEFRFGDYSSVSPDYSMVGTCGVGTNAVVANQYFASDGTWRTRIAEVGSC